VTVEFKSEYATGTFVYNHCFKTDQIQQKYLTHYHDMYELIFLKEGDISYLTGDTVYPVRKNSLIFTRPGQQHRIRIDKNTPYDRYDLLFNPSEIVSDVLSSIPADTHVICFDSNSLMIQLFDKLDFYCERLNGDALCRILHNLTEEILLNLLLHVTEVNEDKHRTIHPLTRQAIGYIDENLSTLSGVDDICRQIGVSKSYLYRLFQSDLQTTPKTYLMERRLNWARQEIFLGAKASAVYTQCGFSDYSTFFRAYKKYFGYPPTGTHHASFVRTITE
jgi:AraC-like DNA-binding protein